MPKVAYARAIVTIAMFSSILFSSHLWLSADRIYQPIPLLGDGFFMPQPLDKILYCGLLGLLAWLPFSRRQYGTSICLISLCWFLILFDTSRLQPWVYLNLLLFAALATGSRSEQDAKVSLDATRFVILATYFWAAAQKINSSFFTETVPWVFRAVFPGMPVEIAIFFGCIIIALEMVQAFLLLFPPTRKIGIIVCVLSHFMVLSCLGPSGLNWNKVIWPWNVEMVALVVLLFRKSPETRVLDILAPKTVTQLTVFLVAGVFPLLNFFGMWDSYLSAALYSGNVTQCEITFDLPTDRALPAKLIHYLEIDRSKTPARVKLNLRDVSMPDLNVPAYPEPRILVRAARNLVKELDLKNCRAQLIYRARFFETPMIRPVDVDL